MKEGCEDDVGVEEGWEDEEGEEESGLGSKVWAEHSSDLSIEHVVGKAAAAAFSLVVAAMATASEEAERM